MLTKLQKIQKKVSEIIEPDLEKRLTFGCVILSKYDNGIFKKFAEFKIDDSSCFYDNKILYCSNRLYESIYNLQQIIVLGKQPNLEMLLLAFKKNRNPWSLSDCKESSKIRVFTYRGDFHWQMNQSLENQPEETINTIYKILNLE